MRVVILKYIFGKIVDWKFCFFYVEVINKNLIILGKVFEFQEEIIDGIDIFDYI